MAALTPAFVSTFTPVLPSAAPSRHAVRRRHFTPTATLSPLRTPVSRRAFAALLAAVPLAPLLTRPSPAYAESLPGGVVGQVTLYRDLPKGFTILRPSGWNEFEGLQDNYDIKWQDVIQPLEFITVLTNPVSKDKQLGQLGTAEAVGKRLAMSRGGELISAVEKDIEGVPAYIVEIKREKAHQLTLLTIAKMKLYSVNASCPESRWTRREKLLHAVLDSFKPRL